MQQNILYVYLLILDSEQPQLWLGFEEVFNTGHRIEIAFCSGSVGYEL